MTKADQLEAEKYAKRHSTCSKSHSLYDAELQSTQAHFLAGIEFARSKRGLSESEKPNELKIEGFRCEIKGDAHEVKPIYTQTDAQEGEWKRQWQLELIARSAAEKEIEQLRAQVQKTDDMVDEVEAENEKLRAALAKIKQGRDLRYSAIQATPVALSVEAMREIAREALGQKVGE